MIIGVVGCGYWGSKHVRVLQGIREVAEVIAIDPSQQRLLHLKQAFPLIHTAESLDQVLCNLDGVVLATPPSSHFRLAETVLLAGKHVLVEKPMAVQARDARDMIHLADDSGSVLMVGHTFEYNSAVWKLRDLVRDGDLGTIFYLDSARLNLGLYQSDVNVIWDLAPHDVSIFNHVLGAHPTIIKAWGSRHGHPELEDVAHIRLTYADLGVEATIHVSWLDPCKVRRVTVVGSQKMAVYNDLAADERIRIYDKGLAVPNTEVLQDVPLSYRYGDIRSPYLAFEEPLAVQDREFISAMLTGSQPPTDGRNGFEVVRVLEAAQISLRESRAVEIDEVDTDLAIKGQLASVL